MIFLSYYLVVVVLLAAILDSYYVQAYISDLKLVSCDTQHACANYPGYYKIPTDLNQGVKASASIFLHIKEDPTEDPVTDLVVLAHNQTIPDMGKWTRLNVDLNQFTDVEEEEERPTSLWLYYTKDMSVSKNPVSSIIVKQGTSPGVGAEYKRIPVDLNQGVGGNHLYMYYSQEGSKVPITAITAKQCFTSNCYLDGWERVEKDLNKGVVVGMSVYLFYKREHTEDPVTDVVVILNDQTPPEGYTRVDTNLNSFLRGDAIYLWYRTSPKNPDTLRDGVQELAIEFGKHAVTPYGWTKINVDLNSEHEGQGGFGEPTYLFFRKGHQELPKLEPLTFDENGEFKIVQLADLHFTNEEGKCRDIPPETKCEGDQTTIEYVERVLDHEKPNLVVFTGDNINAEGVSDARAATLKFAESVIKRKTPWVAIFGNHDDGSDLTREELLEVMKNMPYSMTQRGPLDVPGVGNFYLKLYSDSKKSAAVHAFTLYFLDSHAYTTDDDGTTNFEEYDFIKVEQLDWLIRTAKSFGRRKPNAAAFFHIPIWEYNDDIDTSNVKLGDERESVSSPLKNEISALQAFLTAGDIRVTSCGHNHVNDFCMDRNGIQLCYGGGAGVGGYGAEHMGWPRRARVFKIQDFGETIVTWKRLFNEKLAMYQYQTLYSSE